MSSLIFGLCPTTGDVDPIICERLEHVWKDFIVGSTSSPAGAPCWKALLCIPHIALLQGEFVGGLKARRRIRLCYNSFGTNACAQLCQQLKVNITQCAFKSDPGGSACAQACTSQVWMHL